MHFIKCFILLFVVGDYHVRVTAFNELFNVTDVIGPFYVQAMPIGLSLMMNTTIVHKDDYILFSASLLTGSNMSYTWNMGSEMQYTSQGKNKIKLYIFWFVNCIYFHFRVF